MKNEGEFREGGEVWGGGEGESFRTYSAQSPRDREEYGTFENYKSSVCKSVGSGGNGRMYVARKMSQELSKASGNMQRHMTFVL